MIKGYEAWRSKLPGYRGPRVLLFPLLAFLVVVVGQAFLIAIESLGSLATGPRFLDTFEPLFPVIATAAGLVGGFVSLYGFWARRDRYLAESEETAYQRGLPFGVVGAGLIFTTMLNGFVPAYQLSIGRLGRHLSVTLATPAVTWPPRLVLGAALLLIAVVHGARTIRSFGVDYMLGVYLYYPEESTVQGHEVYSVMRHPTYSGWLLVVASGALIRASLYGVIDLLLFTLAVTVWVRRFEEPELADRFGDDYREYMREVPAFVPRWDGLGDYVAFLLGRD